MINECNYKNIYIYIFVIVKYYEYNLLHKNMIIICIIN